MNVLGISGRESDAAAALAVDGRVVSAVAEESFARVPHIGYARTGGFPHAAVRACLEAAGLDPSDVNQIVVVDDGATRQVPSVNGSFRSVPIREMSPERAEAVHALAESTADLAVVGGAGQGGMSVFSRASGGLGPRQDIPGTDEAFKAARLLATSLGADTHDPIAGLDRASVGGDPEMQDRFASAFYWSPRTGVSVDRDAIAATIAGLAGEYGTQFADTTSVNTRLQQMRRALAASFLAQFAQVIAAACTQALEQHRASTVAAGGPLFSHARVNTEVQRLLRQEWRVAAVPEAAGRAVGAAASEPGAIATVGRGPAFSDEDIKRTLDNCRLDYVYEPDWSRLIARVSRMLARGKVVGWFQGALAFGPRPAGTRSALSDPSSRYARQNVNEYLRQLPIDEPLPVAFADSAKDAALELDGQAHGVVDAVVRSDWRSKLSGATDWRSRVRVHAPGPAFEKPFASLLEHHFATTGTPGLIETGLAGTGEPLACTPRDAVRTVYSSAIDALVIGRFLLMKDYWLLRSEDQ